MGSLFSRHDDTLIPAQAEANAQQRSNGITRYHDSAMQVIGEPAAKRRRVSKKTRRENMARAPPTRAMQYREQKGQAVAGAPPFQNAAHATNGGEIPKRRKRKVAVFLGYIGERYYGMQMNPGVITIEQVLLTAFHRAGLISEANKDSLSKVHWMRAARTDKGVSAAGQCVSAKLECEVLGGIDTSLVDAINYHLPEDVQVYGMLRATAAFNARSDCHRRRYEYMFPVRLLGGRNGLEKEVEKGAGDPRSARLTSILQQYEGTHCFANFTDGLSGSDAASKRYMLRVNCGQPFLPHNSGVYYVSIEIFGQSFVLHQIRKMVGLALFVYLGHAPPETIPVALCPDVKIPTPMAPALGLLLDSLVFANYNARYLAVLEEPISVDAFAGMKSSFKERRIYCKIAERERLERILETWMKTCYQKQQYKPSDIADLHAKFVLTDQGREEQRKAHVASLYPIRTNMQDFIDSSDVEFSQLATHVKSAYETRFKTAPTFLAKAPGRVIFIGEHLDYNGLPVISAATAQGTIVAGCLDHSGYIDVCHVDTDRYRDGRLRSNGCRVAFPKDETNIELDGNWLQYVSWGIKALVETIGPSKKTVRGGGRLLFGGNLPRAGGLASSSSLVTVSALVAARLNRRRIPKQEIAELAAAGERVGAGTRGGAVDHTVSMCGVRGKALQVSFTPHLGIAELKMPTGASFFAVNSGISAEKGFDEAVKHKFNLRAAECRIAAALIARRLEVYLWKSVTTPGQLLFQANKTAKLECKTISKLKEKAGMVMPLEEVATSRLIMKELEISEIELQNRFLVGVQADSFEVGKRMAHIFSETERVEMFAAVSADETASESNKLVQMGQILNEGQVSLKTFFESSCQEVDELVAYCLESGAIGSRMTGAGWGGYVLNIVANDKVAHFLNAVIERMGDLSVVEICPSSGACIYAIHNTYGIRSKDHK